MGSNETRNLWLSILFGVFASFLIYSYSQEKKAEYDKKFGAIKSVVVAKMVSVTASDREVRAKTR